jgi:signal transduction histidine kinase
MSGRRLAEWLRDGALAATVVVLGLVELWAPLPSVTGPGARWPSTVVVLLAGLLLLFSRARPLVVQVLLVLVMVPAMASGLVHVLFWGGFLPLMISVFFVARHGRGREPVYGAATAAATWLIVDLTVEALQSPGEIVFHWLVTTVVWCFGWGLRRSERRAAASLERAVAAEVTAAEQAKTAIAQERARIARELHDIVTHSVSVMVVQAGAAELVVDDDPEYTRNALRSIRLTGKEALEEMRRVVTILREGEEEGGRRPQPGVEAIATLADEVRTVGLDVDLTTEGEPQPLPPGLDLAAYRIVQEALTNVRRHADATRAEVLLRYGDGQVLVEVHDDGRGAAAASPGGHGLIGMRERVALYGGRVETVSDTGSGFTVRAVLPVAAR